MLRRAVRSFLVNGSAHKMKSAPMSAVQQEKWDLYAGVLVERLPSLTKCLKPIEKQYLVSGKKIGLQPTHCNANKIT